MGEILSSAMTKSIGTQAPTQSSATPRPRGWIGIAEAGGVRSGLETDFRAALAC